MMLTENGIPNQGYRGVLLRSLASRQGEKVCYCARGRRHWITDARWGAENGVSWPADGIEGHADVLDALLPGQNAPLRHDLATWRMPDRVLTTWGMRELSVSRLKGSGIEVGAGANPMPIPLHCQIKYVDIFDVSQLQEHRYDGQESLDILRPDIVAMLGKLDPIAPESLDFVVACHVIEHTRDPIAAIADAWDKIKRGGSLVLVVPEISRTFDKHRALTELGHLIDDFKESDPGRRRDMQHFQEFYAKAFVTPAELYVATWREKWAEDFPIHYHTWTHQSFMEMIDWMMSESLLPGLQEAWSRPPLPADEGCIEFWVVLRKEE